MSAADDQQTSQQEMAGNTVEAPSNATPLPAEGDGAPEREKKDVEESEVGTTDPTTGQEENVAVPTDDLPPPGHTAPHPGMGLVTEGSLYPIPGAAQGYPSMGHRAMTDLAVPQTPLTINQLAIVASAQNKLPVNKCKGIVLRVGRHTESSLHKSGKWYKNQNYVDKDSYTWRNMPLFEDYQRHLWTTDGCVKSSCKK